MENAKPFIHKFSTKDHHYIYDVNSNRVFQVGKITSGIIDYHSTHTPAELTRLFPHYAQSEIKRELKEIKDAAAEKNLFSANRPDKFVYQQNPPVKELLAGSSLGQLILNVTEMCNFRCTYCTYGGRYKNRRTHSEKKMSWQIARKAVDRYLERAGPEVRLSFYGGEPLLNFSLIKKIVAYVEKKTTRKINWNMTTNGSLLNPGICDFLKERNFNITVSLDGSRDIHDRYRINTRGNGTFDKIYKNLQYLYHLDRDYYHRHILFSIVCAPPFRLGEISGFFSSDPLVRENSQLFSFMDYTIQDFPYQTTDEDYGQMDAERETLLQEYFKEIKTHKRQFSLQQNLFEKDMVRFYHRPKTVLGDTIPLNGCCLPSTRRLFVSADGILYICEKEDSAYPIGNVDTWIDPEAVERLITEYEQMSGSCFDCWACRLCSACFASHVKDGALDPGIRESECVGIRMKMHMMMENYYGTLESDLSAFDHFSDIQLV